MRSTNENTTTTKSVSLTVNRYGNLEPQVVVLMAKGTNPRVLNAALHRLAAEVELATPGRERWIVQTEACADDRGRVFLELMDGTKPEAERALAVLQPVAR